MLGRDGPERAHPIGTSPLGEMMLVRAVPFTWIGSLIDAALWSYHRARDFVGQWTDSIVSGGIGESMSKEQGEKGSNS